MAKGGGDWHTTGSKMGMAALRVFLGAFFLYDVWPKIIDMGAFIAAFKTAASAGGVYVAGNGYGWLAKLFSGPIASHAGTVAWVIVIVEIVIGILLLLGLLTRAASFIAMVIMAVYILATSHIPSANLALFDSTAVDIGLLVIAFVLILSAAGRTLGLDSLLASRTRWKILW